MSKTSTVIAKIPTTTPQVLEVSVSYDKAGTNFLSGKHSDCGYFLHITPVTIKKLDGGISCREFSMGTGLKHMIQPAKRFSAKTFANVVEQVKNDKALVDRIAQGVVADSIARKYLYGEPIVLLTDANAGSQSA